MKGPVRREPHLEGEHVVHGRGAVVVVRARLCDAWEQVVQVERHDLVIDVDVSGVGCQHLQPCQASPSVLTYILGCGQSPCEEQIPEKALHNCSVCSGDAHRGLYSPAHRFPEA